MTKYIFSLFAALVMVSALGCGGEGGDVGDDNDPAIIDDTDQMDDEMDEEASP